MRPEVWEAMAPYALEKFGNSSGVHEVSRRAKNALEAAREQIAALIGAMPIEIVFTSGGTESDNLALKGAAWRPGDRNGVVTVATEHEAVLESVDAIRRFGGDSSVLSVDTSGRVDAEELADSVAPSTGVVSVMTVNNETGVVHDISDLARRVHERDEDVLFHTDAVQAFSSQDLDVSQLGADLVTVSGHKFGGPKGTGLLYVREGTYLEPLVHGGGQELGRRSGTHHVAGAVGLARAMELAVKDRDRFRAEIGGIRDRFETRLASGVEGLVVNTPIQSRSHHHLSVRIPGVRNETLLMRLDRAGVAASAGSACQSGAATVSHVLEAMGLSASQARECIRFTFGWTSTDSEASEAADVVIDLVERLR